MKTKRNISAVSTDAYSDPFEDDYYYNYCHEDDNEYISIANINILERTSQNAHDASHEQ
jgi:hypothetical protein